MLKTERLNVVLREFQVQDGPNGRGTWSGYANTFGFLDSNYGGINIPGCFTQSLPSFLQNGFVPDSHSAANNYEYTILGTYGYPTLCREDAKGLYFEGEFHGDSEAQVVRQRMQERQAAGLSVGMSIGWSTEKSFRIYPKDYQTELPKYLSAEEQQAGLKEALNWPSILIRQQNNLIETSLTLTPANTQSLVTEVQSKQEMKSEKLGTYLDVDTELGLTQISVLINALFYGIAYDVFCDPVPSAENRVVWQGALMEFVGYCLQIYDAYIAAEAAEGEPMNDEMGNPVSTEDMPMMAAQFFRNNFINPKLLAPAGAMATKQFAQHALTVVRQFHAHEQSLAEKRAQRQILGRLAGKVISQPNHDALKDTTDALESEMADHQKAMKQCVQDLRTFLDKFDPKSDKANAEDVNSRQSKLRALSIKQLALN